MENIIFPCLVLTFHSFVEKLIFPFFFLYSSTVCLLECFEDLLFISLYSEGNNVTLKYEEIHFRLYKSETLIYALQNYIHFIIDKDSGRMILYLYCDKY